MTGGAGILQYFHRRPGHWRVRLFCARGQWAARSGQSSSPLYHLQDSSGAEKAWNGMNDNIVTTTPFCCKCPWPANQAILLQAQFPHILSGTHQTPLHFAPRPTTGMFLYSILGVWILLSFTFPFPPIPPTVEQRSQTSPKTRADGYITWAVQHI